MKPFDNDMVIQPDQEGKDSKNRKSTELPGGECQGRQRMSAKNLEGRC